MNEKVKSRIDVPLIMVMVLSAFLNGFNIWKDEFANAYYTSAVASMLQSFHNFFFASFDPGGYVTVDKPPVTFWIQTLSASLFGLHGWSVILPQALAGVGSVLIVYLLVKPTFGITAARLSALALATTPVLAAVSRTNNIDSLLVFALLLGAWFLFKGIKSNRIWAICAGFAMVGVAFNMKMLQAYMILPAFYLFYWIACKFQWKKKLSVLAGATAALVVVSLSWAVIVDAIPEDQRPYIGSSQTNSVLELAFGYNGLARLTGDRGGSQGTQNTTSGMNSNMKGFSNGATSMVAGETESPPTLDGNGATSMDDESKIPDNNGLTRDGDADSVSTGSDNEGGPGNMGGNRPSGNGGTGGGGMFNTGTKGPLRLFQSELSGQASWLIPFAFFACVGLLSNLRRRNITQKHKEVMFWIAWLVPGMAFFSVAGFFHQYYLIMIAPPIAALVGAGWTDLWNKYRNQSEWSSWLLPLGVLTTTVFECFILQPYDEVIGSGWSIGITVAGIGITILLVVFKWRNKEHKFSYTTAVVGVLVLFIGPLYWAATPITYGQSSQLPAAGPGETNSRGSFGGGIGMPGQAMNGGTEDKAPTVQGTQNQGVDDKTYSYLMDNYTGERFIFATTEYSTAASYIIQTGQAVMAMGGYSGSDPILTVEKLEAMVADGEIKYFLLSSGGMGGRGGSSELTAWIIEHGEVIPSDEWQTSTEIGNEGFSRNGSKTLYRVTL